MRSMPVKGLSPGSVRRPRRSPAGRLAVDAADHAGWRPLMLATDPAILEALLRAGARPELDAEERRLLGRAADRQRALIDAVRHRLP
ncbi:MAG: hypothetical protein ABI689_00750 [Thermoanaerobaculia bacterium]